MNRKTFFFVLVLTLATTAILIDLSPAQAQFDLGERNRIPGNGNVVAPPPGSNDDDEGPDDPIGVASSQELAIGRVECIRPLSDPPRLSFGMNFRGTVGIIQESLYVNNRIAASGDPGESAEACALHMAEVAEAVACMAGPVYTDGDPEFEEGRGLSIVCHGSRDEVIDAMAALSSAILTAVF